MRVLLLFVLTMCVTTFGCKDEPRYIAGAGTSEVDRNALCAGGGATLDQATNECVCNDAQKWNGLRCEAAATATTTQAASLPTGVAPQAPEEAPEDEVEPAAAPTAEPVDVSAAFTTRLASACRRARGTWLERDGYCHCPKDQVLVARRCRTLQGNVTDDTCMRAVSKGAWKKSGECRCEPGLVFSPSRGGCVAKFTGDTAVLRRICESSLNLGKWDAQGVRCRCPSGRVWHNELCQVQQKLSSKTVCESDFNRGTWQSESKSCVCADGLVWINQACRALKQVSDEVACARETNGGRWDKNRCICPGLTRWDAVSKSCAR